MNIDNDTQSNDLTQLSSREQLSALMDGALPEDQTRFLLRRLQHDAELAGSWERWRIAGEALRGQLPARQLPMDFSVRVAAALHADAVPPLVASSRRPAWQRWGGGAALAAALAVVALMLRPALVSAPQSPVHPAPAIAAVQSAPPAQTQQPAPTPAPLVEAPQLAAAVASVAVAARPQRRKQAQSALRIAPESVQVASVASPVAAGDALPALPEAEIATRPWPRSVLPQYDHRGGLTVGFGEHASPQMRSNPFVASVFDAPPRLRTDEAAPESASAPPGDAQPQP